MLTITVEAGWGDTAEQTIPEMVRLASLLGVAVCADLDRVKVTAQPGDDAAAILLNWRRALKLPPPRAASAIFPDLPPGHIGQGRPSRS